MILKEVKSVEEPNVVPTEIKSLFNEFKEIICNDMSKWLPLVRSISHQINLMLRSILPNKVPYKMTPKKSEEMNRQVHELLDRGLIREILIPCAVPTMLTPKKIGEWWMCTNLCAINKITIKYRFPFSGMDDLIDFLSGSEYF